MDYTLHSKRKHYKPFVSKKNALDNKYTQGPPEPPMPSSALKEHTCPSAPAALHPIKTKTTKKKNKNRSGGGNNFDAFFFSFSFNKNEKQCFTLQKASVALANKEKTHGDASVDLKWNFKCLQDFENFNDRTNCGCTDPDLTLEDQEEKIIPEVTELLTSRGDVSTVGSMAQFVAFAASDLGGGENNVATVRGFDVDSPIEKKNQLLQKIKNQGLMSSTATASTLKPFGDVQEQFEGADCTFLGSATQETGSKTAAILDRVVVKLDADADVDERKESFQKMITKGEALPSSLNCAAVDVCFGDAMNAREAVTGAVVAGAVRDAAVDAKSTSVLDSVLGGGGTGERKEGSQKIISQGEALSSSLDYAALDVCCGDAMNVCGAVTGAVVAGAVRDAAADATSASLRDRGLRGEGAGEMKEGSQKIISQGGKTSSSLDLATSNVCCNDAREYLVLRLSHYKNAFFNILKFAAIILLSMLLIVVMRVVVPTTTIILDPFLSHNILLFALAWIFLVVHPSLLTWNVLTENIHNLKSMVMTSIVSKLNIIMSLNVVSLCQQKRNRKKEMNIVTRTVVPTGQLFSIVLIIFCSIHSCKGQSGSSGSLSAAASCPKGQYRGGSRRFLHSRPLSTSLDIYKKTSATKTIPKNPKVSSIHKLLVVNFTSIYYLSDQVNHNDIDPVFNAIRSFAPQTIRFESIHPDNIHIIWEEPPPTNSKPTIPLYWINLNSGMRYASMVQQLAALQWENSRRVQAYDGRSNTKNQDGDTKATSIDQAKAEDGFKFLDTLMDNDSALKARHTQCWENNCSATQIATTFSHVNSIRQAWNDGHPFVLVVEDDVDFSLYDETVLRESIIKNLPSDWGSVQLYTGDYEILEELFSKHSADFISKHDKSLRNRSMWSNACVLYSRRGMKNVLDAFGYEGFYSLPRQPSGTIMSLEADVVIPNLVKRAFLTTRPLVNVKVAKSTIDKYHFKPILADLMISKYAHLLLGHANKYRYGSITEIARTSSHIRLLAHAYKAGLSSVLVADHDLQVKLVNFSEVERVLSETKSIIKDLDNDSGDGMVVQLASSSNIKNITTSNSATVVPHSHNTHGTSLYLVIGRSILRSFAMLWDDVDSTIFLPKNTNFVADVFLYRWTKKAMYAPNVALDVMPSKHDWSGISRIPMRRLVQRCLNCQIGKYNDQTGKQSCKTCTAGSVTDTLAATKGTKCTSCSAGQYTSSSQTACATCPAGSMTDTLTAASGTTCTACTAGQFTASSQIACDVCSAGSVTDTLTAASGTTCTACTAGQFTASSQIACDVCAAGSYNDKIGQIQCKLCPRGRHNHMTNQDDIDDCIKCPQGRTGDGIGGAINENEGCVACSVGFFSEEEGTNECLSCPKGYNQNETTQIYCKLCPAGETTLLTKSKNCDECLIGTYLSEKMRRENSKCLPCTVIDFAGATSCPGCPVGRGGSLNATEITQDKPYPGCDECNPGEYSIGGDLSSCKSCPRGWYGKLPGEDFACLACIAGKYSDVLTATSNTTCLDCDKGKYSDFPGKTDISDCKLCPKGTWNSFVAQNHLSKCLNCQQGFYNEIEGLSEECKACEKGTYMDKKASKQLCKNCPNGWYGSEKKLPRCNVCIPGKYSKSDEQIVDCKFCNVGRFSSNAKMDKCQDCPNGRPEGKEGQNVCEPCIPGKNRIGKQCVECQPGKFTNVSDSPTCVSCPKGFFINESLSSFCLPCLPGKFQNVSGFTTCNDCSNGYFASDPKREIPCKHCPGGRTTKEELDNGEGKTVCSDCFAGTYLVGRNLAVVDKSCRKCPVGFSQAEAMKETCHICKPGDFQSEEGQSRCFECDLGKYGVNGGASGCTDCAVGLYQDSKGLRNCKRCPQDTYGNKSGTTSESECERCESEDLTGTKLKTTTGGLDGATNSSDCKCHKLQPGTGVSYYSNGTNCLICPKGASCMRQNGVTIHEMFPNPGYWRAANNATIFSPCSKALVGQGEFVKKAQNRCCPLNTTSNISTCNLGKQGDLWNPDHQCKEGYIGPLCMICDKSNGYIRVGDSCDKCEGGADVTGAIISLVVVCIALMLVAFLVVRNTREPKKITTDKQTDRDHFVGEIVIIISYMQIVSVLARTFSGSVKLPIGFIVYAQGMNAVNFDLAYIMPYASCRLSIPFDAKLLLHLITPIAFFISIKIAQVMATLIGKNSKTKLLIHAQQNQGSTIMINLGILLYPSLTSRIFSAFRCFKVEGVGMLLERDFSILCGSPNHGFIITMAVFGLIVYTAGFPLLLLYDLWRHRKSLHDPKHEDYTLTHLRLGSLYEQYEPFYWYWEPIVIIYKMIMVGALSVIEQHSPVQLFVGFLICGGYLLFVLRSSPYEDESLDKLSFFASLSLALTLLLCLMKGMDEHRASLAGINYDLKPWDMFQTHALTVTMIGVNILPFVYAIGSSLLRWFQHRKMIAGNAFKLAKSMSRRKTTTKVLPKRDREDDQATREWGAGGGSSRKVSQVVKNGGGTSVMIAVTLVCVIFSGWLVPGIDSFCSPGKYIVGYNNCEPCATGQYQNSQGQTSCKPCATGQYQNQNGQSSCKTNCNAGSFIRSDKKVCSACVTGQYQDLNNQPECKSCPSGWTSGTSANSSCIFGTSYTDPFCKTVPNGFSFKGISLTGKNLCCPRAWIKVGDGSKCRTPLGVYPYRACVLYGNDFSSTCPTPCGSVMIATSTTSFNCGSQLVSGTSSNPGVPGYETGCIAGKYAYSDNTGSYCYICATGQYQNLNGQSSCKTNCNAGSFIRSDKKVCSACVTGQYQDLNNQPECKSCPSGWTSGTSANSSCIFGTSYTDPFCKTVPNGFSFKGISLTGKNLCCPRAWIKVGDGSKCRTPLGVYPYRACVLYGNDFSSTCPTPCGSVMIATSTTSFNCGSQLVSGTSSNPGVPGYETGCIAGKYAYSDNTGSYCYICATGQYQNLNSQTSCKSDCSAGSYITSDKRSCSVCIAGQYQNLNSQTSCKNCNAGFFASSDQTACIVNTCTCSSDSTLAATGADCTSNNLEKCSGCATGEVLHSGSCTSCTQGKASTGVNDQCTPCVAGKYQELDSAPAYSCKSCGPGLYGDTAEQTSESVACKDCPKGRWSSASGLDGSSGTPCTGCGLGTYNSQVAQVSVASCTDCGEGKYNDAVGQDDISDCKYCAAGFKFTAKTTVCDECASGLYQEQNNSPTAVCKSCAAGFKFTAKNTVCDECASGLYQEQNNSPTAVCKSCAAGFKFTAKNTVCGECASGLYQEQNDQANVKCKVCEKGTYTENIKSESCTECPIGKHGSSLSGASRSSEQAGCTNCPIGRYKSSVGAEDCQLCKIGKFQSTSSTSTDFIECNLCLAGTYTENTGAANCEKCPEKTYLSESMRHVEVPKCILCLKADKEGSKTCPGCPLGFAGTLVETDGKRDGCRKCTIGKYSSGGDGTECQVCFKGTYGMAEGSYVCTNCLAGRWSEAIGATSNATCIPCKEGRYSSVLGMTKNDCQDCSGGTYSDEIANDHESKCKVCETGRYSATQRRTQPCHGCEKGTFMDKTKSLEPCIECPRGFAMNAKNSSYCDVCYPGRSQKFPKQFECIKCLPGKFAQQMEQKMCTKCPNGRSSVEGQSRCTPCTPGTTRQNQNEWTLIFNKAQDIKESAGVTVLQNEWTLGIAPQVIEKNVGVIVSQGSTTGLLKTALKGETTSVVISVAHDVTFVSGVEIKIDIDQVDGGCVVVGTVNTATKTLTSGILKTGLTGLTTSVVIQTISNDVLFVSNVDVVIGTTIVANNNSNGIRAKNFYQCLVCKVGKFSSGQNANECNNCTKGKYQNENSKSNCLSCIPGRYEDRNGIATECKSCKKDYYAEDVGRKISCEKCQKGRNTNGKDSSTKCSNCPAGQFVNNITQACEACPAGYSQKKAEQPKCEICNIGEESLKKSNVALSSCQSCDLGKRGVEAGQPCVGCTAGMYQDAKRQKVCEPCPLDTYMYDNISITPNATSRAQCIPCTFDKTTGINNASKNETSCLCRKDTYFQNQTTNECSPCPLGAKCTRYDGIDGVTVEEIHPLPGYWRGSSTEISFVSCEKALVGQEFSLKRARNRCCPLYNDTLQLKTDDFFAQKAKGTTVKVNSTCDLGNQGNAWTQDHQCRHGYMGPLCMVCNEENGYIRVGHDCELCEGGANVTGAIMSLFGLCIVLIICVFLYVLRTKEPKIMHADKRGDRDHFIGEIVILVSYMQIVSVLARTLSGSVKLPNEWVVFSNSMFFVNFDLAFAMPFVSCRLSIPYGAKLMLHMATPIAFFISIKIATVLATLIRKKSKSPLLIHAQQNAGLTAIMNLGILLYPSLTTRVFSAFRCFNVDGVGYRLENDFSIACWDNDPRHEFMITLAVLGTLFYTIGFPVWIFFDLWRHRKSLHDADHEDYTLTRLRLGSLYEQYEPYYWFWPPIIILYKMLMVGALSVIEQHSPVQLFVGLLICLGYLLIVLRAAPYEDESLDRLSFFASLSLVLTLLLCLMKGTDEHRAEREKMNYEQNPWDMFGDESLSPLMICINMLPFVYAIGSSLLRWFQHRKQIAKSLSKSMSRRSMVKPRKIDDSNGKAGEADTCTKVMPINGHSNNDDDTFRSWGQQQKSDSIKF